MKHVLVTGAAGGMGKAVVNALAAAGYFVYALDREPCAPSENVLFVPADLTDAADVERAFAQVRKKTDSLYAVLHFAGVYMLDSLAEIEAEAFERAFKINLFAAFRVNQIFLPLLKRGSRILLTSSELAPLNPLPFTGLYAITKAAVEKYAFSLRMELQLLGISVCVLRPGAVKTGMLNASVSALDRFIRKTKLYAHASRRFHGIVESVEAKNVPPERIARKTLKLLKAKRPAYLVKLNRNPLLLLFGILPDRLQTRIIGLLLKERPKSGKNLSKRY